MPDCCWDRSRLGRWRPPRTCLGAWRCSRSRQPQCRPWRRGFVTGPDSELRFFECTNKGLTEQCAPVLVKGRRRLSISDRRQTKIAFELGSGLDRLPLDEEE